MTTPPQTQCPLPPFTTNSVEPNMEMPQQPPILLENKLPPISQNIILSNLSELKALTKPFESYPFIEIRIQQRTSKNFLTFVSGLESMPFIPILESASQEDRIKRLCQMFRRKFKVGGAVVKDKQQSMQSVIQLNGDQRQAVKKFLIDYKLCTAEHIKIHGF